MLTTTQVQAFRDALIKSVLITPGDAEYAQAIKRWNDANEKQAVSPYHSDLRNPSYKHIGIIADYIRCYRGQLFSSRMNRISLLLSAWLSGSNLTWQCEVEVIPIGMLLLPKEASL
jgi:hypothetical protein